MNNNSTYSNRLSSNLAPVILLVNSSDVVTCELTYCDVVSGEVTYRDVVSCELTYCDVVSGEMTYHDVVSCDMTYCDVVSCEMTYRVTVMSLVAQ